MLLDAGVAPCRPSTSGRVPFVPQAVLTTSTARLPATHLEASVKALEQLKTSAVNREWCTDMFPQQWKRRGPLIPCSWPLLSPPRRLCVGDQEQHHCDRPHHPQRPS